MLLIGHVVDGVADLVDRRADDGDRLPFLACPVELEVTLPGHDPYLIGVRTRVPAKAEKVSLLQRHPIPLTLEVPVQVKADDLTRVAIDWPAFLALPDRVPRLLAARDRALAIQVQRLQAAKPDQYAAVLVRLGQMRQEDVDAALASLDAG